MISFIGEILGKNFILTKLNTLRFILTIPLLLIGIRRFFKQIPLEEYSKNKKSLPFFIFDFFSKLIFVLFFILEGILLFWHNKTASIGFVYYMNYTYFFLMGLLVIILIVIEYHPWFITLRMIMYIFLHISPKNFNVLLFNVLFIILCEVGLRQKPWVEKVSYTLFRHVSMLTVVLCFLKSRRFLFL